MLFQVVITLYYFNEILWSLDIKFCPERPLFCLTLNPKVLLLKAFENLQPDSSSHRRPQPFKPPKNQKAKLKKYPKPNNLTLIIL